MKTTTEIIEAVARKLPGDGWVLLDAGAGMVTVSRPNGSSDQLDASVFDDADEVERAIGAMCLRHSHDQPCPVTGKHDGDGSLAEIFSDHDRPGHVLNACHYCHRDQRTTAERLRDLNNARRRG